MLASMLINQEVKNMAGEGIEFCKVQTDAQVAIEERMNEMAEEMVVDSMRTVLKKAAKESYEFNLFDVGM